MANRELKWKLTAKYLAPFVLAMVVLTAILLWRIETQVATADWVEHSDRVIMRAKDAQLEMRRIQLGVRGYLYSPDRRFLDEINVGRHEFARNLAIVASLLTDNPDEERRLLLIADLKENWLKAIESVLREKDSGNLTAMPELLKESEAQERALFSAMDNLSTAEYAIRMRKTSLQAEENFVLIILVPLLSAIVILFLSYWGWRQIRGASEQFAYALRIAEEAQARTAKASRAKDAFLSTVSHELRNPLNSIMLWSSTLLSDQAVSPRTRRGLSAIDRAVRAQTQLVNDLLDISRIETGRMRLDVQSVDLAEVVKAAAESMRAAAEAKSITLQEITDPRLPMVFGDPGRLQQVVWNLISNAVKFTPKYGKIQVRVVRINSNVEITVADTGQGIDAASLGSVFDRFWQAENPGQSNLGVGLGLSIVKEIVNLHGGTVSAESDGIGKGSTFTIRLAVPVGQTALTALHRHPTLTGAMAGTNAPRLDGYLILVVDDDPGACEALQNLLTSLGARVTAATSAEAALAILDRMHPDAVVSDIGMPVHDGYFFAREMRKREETADRDRRLPLVALTAYGRVEDKVKIFEAGFDNHVVKPVDPAELSAVLGTAISLSGIRELGGRREVREEE